MINLRTWTEERLYEARTISREGERLSSYWMGGRAIQIQRMRLHRVLGAAACVCRGHLIEISRMREGWSLSQLMPLKGVEENIDEADEADAIRISDI